MIEGSLGVKLAPAWIAEKQRGEEAEKKVRRESQRRRGSNQFGSATFECIASIENYVI